MSQRARHVCLALSLCIGASGVTSLPAWGQLPPPPLPPGGGFIFLKHGPGKCAGAGLEIPQKQSDREKTGAPYSGVGTTEVVMTLADGNRIVRKNTMRYYRDSSGRTRTEFDLSTVGPVALDSRQAIVTINDPVAKERYVLHPQLKRADLFKLDGTEKGPPGKALAIQGRTTVKSGAPGGDVVFVTGGPATGAVAGAAGVMRFEWSKEECDDQGTSAPTPVSLGEKTIDGIRTVGSRLDVTIPAGEFGNELPMTIRSEQWYSPDLGVVMLSTHSDPMSGQTTYRLSQISRTEPDAALFTVPADYTVQEAPAPQHFEVKLENGRKQETASQPETGARTNR